MFNNTQVIYQQNYTTSQQGCYQIQVLPTLYPMTGSSPGTQKQSFHATTVTEQLPDLLVWTILLIRNGMVNHYTRETIMDGAQFKQAIVMQLR